MRNEYSNIERLAMLLELGLNYREEFDNAKENKDPERILMLTELIGCVGKLIKDIEENK